MSARSHLHCPAQWYKCYCCWVDTSSCLLQRTSQQRSRTTFVYLSLTFFTTLHIRCCWTPHELLQSQNIYSSKTNKQEWFRVARCQHLISSMHFTKNIFVLHVYLNWLVMLFFNCFSFRCFREVGEEEVGGGWMVEGIKARLESNPSLKASLWDVSCANCIASLS